MKGCNKKLFSKNITMPQLHLILHGKVQGVGLRIASQMKAQTLNLTGFARNLNSDSVEILASGDRKNLEKFLSWIKQLASTKIKSIEEEWKKKGKNFFKFNVF